MIRDLFRREPNEPLFDINDVVFFTGFALASVGGCMLSVPWTLIIDGAVLALKAHGPILSFRRGD